MFYLPALYYPIQKDDRATGILMPTLRRVHLQGVHAEQRVLLGDQPEPGRDVHVRLVQAAGPGLRRRVPLRGRRGLERLREVLQPARARVDLHGRRRQPDGAAGENELRGAVERQPRARAPLDGPRPRGLLHRHHGQPGLQHRHLRHVAQFAHVRRRHQRQPAGLLDQRHLRPHRVLRRPRRLHGHRLVAAHHGVAQREAAVRGRAGLFRREHRVRQPRPPEPLRRRRHRRPRPAALRRDADGARAVHQAPLPHGQLVGRVARHLVEPQPVGGGRRDGARPGDQAVRTSTSSRA